MGSVKVYLYSKCGTCRKAVHWLEEHYIEFQELAIRQTPPTSEELAMAMETEGNIRKILNTSSKDYRDLGLKDQLETLSQEEVFELLQRNGNLVKRPFVVANGLAWSGFKPEVWRQRLLS